PVGRIVSLEVGPDGALYYVSFTDSGGAYGQPNPIVSGAVRRYVYDGGNARPAITEFTAQPLEGTSPLAVEFRIRAHDEEGDPITYVVDFGDGETTGEPQPLANDTLVVLPHVYATDGAYTARLQISDGLRTDTEVIHFRVGTPPVILSLTFHKTRP